MRVGEPVAQVQRRRPWAAARSRSRSVGGDRRRSGAVGVARDARGRRGRRARWKRCGTGASGDRCGRGAWRSGGSGGSASRAAAPRRPRRAGLEGRRDRDGGDPGDQTSRQTASGERARSTARGVARGAGSGTGTPERWGDLQSGDATGQVQAQTVEPSLRTTRNVRSDELGPRSGQPPAPVTPLGHWTYADPAQRAPRCGEWSCPCGGHRHARTGRSRPAPRPQPTPTGRRPAPRRTRAPSGPAARRPVPRRPRRPRGPAPGTVVRSRRSAGLPRRGPPAPARAWQLAYRSTDLHGGAEVAVTTVVLPRAARARRRRRLVAYQCAIDAISDRCFPSYALRPGALPWGALPPLELIIIAALLERGFAVVDRRPRGPRRSLRRAARARLPRPRRSAGGARLRARWACRDDTPVGAVRLLRRRHGVVVGRRDGADVRPRARPGRRRPRRAGRRPGRGVPQAQRRSFAGLPALVVAGLRHAYPGLARVIREHTDAEGQRRLDALHRMTTVGAVTRYAFDDFDDYLDAPLADVLAQPRDPRGVPGPAARRATCPTCPLLVVQAHPRPDHRRRRHRPAGGEVRRRRRRGALPARPAQRAPRA